jgi:predicted nucleotidyltransferase
VDMKIAAIIAEYAPFHNGHALHIARTREMCDAVVCIMDGHVSQRGEIMPLSRWSRARAALLNGADAVVELPSLFACRTADRFAAAGVKIAYAIGADMLSFGSEIADMAVLREFAAAKEDAAAREAISRAMAQGKTLPRARAEAGLAPAEPNAILAVEYIRALNALGEGAPAPMAVFRDNDYHSEALGRIASATAVRAGVKRGDPGAELALPESARFQAAEMAARHELDDLALHALRTLGAQGISRLPDVSEGLENRVYAAACRAATLDGMLEDAKCKRYTRARLMRLAAHGITGLTAELAEKCPEPGYVRVIGARDSRVLREISLRARLPMVSAPDIRGDACFEFECRVTDIWALSRSRADERCAGQEFTRKFVKP